MSSLNTDKTSFGSEPETPQVPALAPGALFADRYEIIRELGSGGMGAVYLARDRTAKENIALKLLHPALFSNQAALDRLVNEGTLARKVRHPNIVAVHDVAVAGGQAYLSMEFVQGGTLRDWLTKAKAANKEVPAALAVKLTGEILAGLSAAHKLDIVHRDLKPENVMLAGDPFAGATDLKILDFGIARAPAQAVAATGASGRGLTGTLNYMSPEQKTPGDVVGPASDLYSVAVMLFEMLMENAVNAGRVAPSRDRSDVPKMLDAVIEKGLKDRPRDRFASAADFSAALEKAMGPAVSPPPPPPPPEKDKSGKADIIVKQEEKKPSRRNYWIAAGVALLIIGVAGNLMDGKKPARDDFDANGKGGQVNNGGGKIPLPPLENYSGLWNIAGFQYSVSHDGRSYRAVGTNSPLEFSGSLVKPQGSLPRQDFPFSAYDKSTGLKGSGSMALLDESHAMFRVQWSNGVSFSLCGHIRSHNNPDPPECR